MYNKKVLKKITSSLDKAKKPAVPKDIIVDPKGQWNHPGKVTRIPASNITMQGVNYPVMGVPNIGMPVMMYPGQDYDFPNADYAADHTLCLPIHQSLSSNDIEYVVNKIKEFGNKFC